VLLPARAELRHEPLGVVLVVSPWNYPVNLLLVPLAAALAAGNCVVLKPSELAPRTSALLAALVPRYLDPAAVAVCEGGEEVTTALIDGGVDHLFFTGSPAVGRLVMARAALHLTPVTLELGGKSPAYVDASAKLEVAARRLVWGKFLNAGQTCIAPDYVLVHRDIADQLVEALAKMVGELYGPEPAKSPDYGRIVDERHLRRLEELLASSGGRVVRGGEVDYGTRYFAPTILTGVSSQSRLMQEEIFGPLLPVLTVEDESAALEEIASHPTPLCAYVFAEDGEILRRFAAGTRSGSVCANTTLEHFAASTLPFGGLGESGTGRYHGRFGFETFSQLRPVLVKATRPSLKIAHPPYSKFRRMLLRHLL
jgi:aldehyde dehydrogenase (NAD+)